MMMTRWRRARNDNGFTMVELLVYSILLIVILGIAATLFIRMLTVQRDIKAIADANNTAQVTFSELERDIRNAQWVTVAHSGDLIVMATRTATVGDDGDGRCVGYHVDEVSGELRRTTSGNGDRIQAALSASNSTALAAVTSAWAVSRDGMGPIGARAFGPADDTYQRNQLVELALAAETIEDRPPVELTKSVALRPQANLTVSCG